MISLTCTFRDIVRVRSFNQNNEKAKQLHEMYHGRAMGERRLSSLAIMHIKYNVPIDLDEVVSLFEGLHPRMKLQSLLYETE